MSVSGANTSNFSFSTLGSADTAGYGTINELITSIDTSLYTRVAKPGMIMVHDTSIGGVPTSWTNKGTSIAGSGLPTLSSPYVYIKKA